MTDDQETEVRAVRAEARAAELEKRIESGRAAHTEERVARDWLAREKSRLEARVAELEKAIGKVLEAGLGTAFSAWGGFDDLRAVMSPPASGTLAGDPRSPGDGGPTTAVLVGSQGGACSSTHEPSFECSHGTAGCVVTDHYATACRAETVSEDWTRSEDGRANSSAVFRSLVDEVERVIRGDAHKLIEGRAGDTARLIMARLAHVHGFGPGKARAEGEEGEAHEVQA